MGTIFFFQAEDGIRDPLVTGVQTCALPISSLVRLRRSSGRHLAQGSGSRTRWLGGRRSEERRVGKECRSRWSPYHEKKKRSKSAPARDLGRRRRTRGAKRRVTPRRR